ncbi:MAG: thioredoxin [Clostridiales bacterium]|nr:thioredoxin [Clostridiales bacterium]
MEEFEQCINSDKPVVVDFWAKWCYPCKMQTPILHEFAAELGDKVKVIKVDVDENPDIAVKLSIASIPTLFVYKNGELKEKTVGLTTKANLSDMVIKHI